MSTLTRSPDEAAATERTGARGLCVVSDAESEATLRRLAAQLPEVELDIRRGDALTAARHIEKHGSPGVLLVDCSSHDLPVTAMESLAQVCDPGVRVIAVGERNDIALYREMLRLGADDYLFKPLTVDLLLRCLAGGEVRTAPSDNARLGRVVAVQGARGGAGATSIAVNLAAHLAGQGRRRIALVDLDPDGGTAALMLDREPNSALRDAVDDPDRVDDLFVERALIPVGERFGLLASPATPGRAAEFDPAAVLAVLERLRARHHYVVVDLPRGASPAIRAVLAHASYRLLVTGPCLAGARHAARTAASLAGAGGRTVTILNRAGMPGALAPAEFRQALGRDPDLAIPWRPKPLAEAATLGEPALRRDRPFGMAIAALAAELSGSGVAGSPGWRRWIAGLRRPGRKGNRP